MRSIYLYCVFSLFLLSGCKQTNQVDLIVYNARIYTVDSAFTVAEAFAVKDGKFIAIGSGTTIRQQYTAKEEIDANGKAIYPGFYDAHAHFFLLGELLDQVDLMGSKSFEEVITRLQAYHKARPEKKWIIGGGWDQNLWKDKKFPTKELLDKAFPDIPVYLSRVDYHAAVVNTQALRMAKVTEVRTIEGGLIGGENGIPNGILVDNAMDLVSKQIPEAEESAVLQTLQVAQDSLLSVGLTSIVDAGLTHTQLGMLKDFYKRNELKIRDYAMIAANPENISHYLKDGVYDTDRLTIRSFKLLADGALGSRGACLLAHYHDAPTKGFLLHSPAAFDTVIHQLANSPFQVNTHAIGDSANRIILDVYGKYLKDNINRRWRIEHAQIIAPGDFHKFRQFHIIPSVQPTHATSDMYWAKDRLGEERLKGAYAYKNLLQEYGMLALGSDFPVEHFNPLYGFHAAVARVDAKGFPQGGFQMENAISREQALRGMTIWAAYSCFQEKQRGSIEKGKDADFVILNKDIMQIPNQELRGTKVIQTVIAGETVFIRK
ncbi:amidohydrolase [Sphingobacterium spiritivorum]|uniref:amidohydrolase n=1 Tax=Sphingobacterium spiritivorum TaxID=258 RepID=UPI00191B1BA3|nr:amidohydrolase [Sphingobacterium spiritivorum]QQT27230.1 amidohydrolase [Sphingobacterium spiritivorum]